MGVEEALRLYKNYDMKSALINSPYFLTLLHRDVKKAIGLCEDYSEAYGALIRVLQKDYKTGCDGLARIIKELKSVEENPESLISGGSGRIKDFYELVSDLEELSAPHKKQQKEITPMVGKGYTAKFPYTSAGIRGKTGLNIVEISSYTRSLAKGIDYIVRNRKRRFSEHGLAKLNSKARKKK